MLLRFDNKKFIFKFSCMEMLKEDTQGAHVSGESSLLLKIGVFSLKLELFIIKSIKNLYVLERDNIFF